MDAAAQEMPQKVLLGAEASLSYVSAATVRDSLIYVLQPIEASVKIFTVEGTYVRTIGREGRGPGEFARPRHGGFIRDSLWVYDPSLGRVSWFAADDFAGSHSFRAGHVVLPMASGRYAMWGGPMALPRLSIVDGTGAELAELGTYPGAKQMDIEVGSWHRIAPQPYNEAPRIAVLDDSVWIAENRLPNNGNDSSLTLIAVGSDGGRRKTVIPLRPERLQPAERDSVIARWVDDIVDFGRVREMTVGSAERLRSLVDEAVEWPEYLPLADDLLSGCGGLLLVRGLGRMRLEWIQIEGGVPARRITVPAGWRAVSRNCEGVIVVREALHGVPEVIQVEWPTVAPQKMEGGIGG